VDIDNFPDCYEEPLEIYEECSRCGWNQIISVHSELDPEWEKLHIDCPQCYGHPDSLYGLPNEWLIRETGWYINNPNHPMADYVLTDYSIC